MEKARMLINYDVEEKSVDMKVTKSRGGAISQMKIRAYRTKTNAVICSRNNTTQGVHYSHHKTLEKSVMHLSKN